MPSFFGELKKACLELLAADPASTVAGRFWQNTTGDVVKTDNGTNKRALLRNDLKCAIGNNGTANNNIRLHRGADGVIQLLLAGDATAEGSKSTSLAQISIKLEAFTDAGKPAAGNAGRAIWVSDNEVVQVDNGVSWETLVTAESLVDDVTIESVGGTLQVKDGGIDTDQLADGSLSADAAGRAKMDDGFLTTAKLGIAGGSTAAVGYPFESDPNTGLYSPTVDVAGMVTAGVERHRWLADGSQKSVITSGSTLYPAFQARSWASIDMTDTAHLAGTYERTLTTVTVTATAHGLQVGHVQHLDFTSGVATDGTFTVVSVADANTFTITHPVSGTTSGNVNLLRYKVLGSGNIACVSKSKSSGVIDVAAAVAVGYMFANFSSAMPDVNYAVITGCGSGNGALLYLYDGTFSSDGKGGRSTMYTRFFFSNDAGSSAGDVANVMPVWFR